MSRNDTPHIRKGSRLDRLLDKSFPTEKERQEMVSLLSEIQDPTPKEKRLLEICEKLITPDETAKADSLAEKLRTADAAILDAADEAASEWPALEKGLRSCSDTIRLFLANREGKR